jgi:hypothetical protein
MGPHRGRAKSVHRCENVCGLWEVFIWREPRSSRVSRDLEKTLSRDLGFGGVTALPVGRRRIFYSNEGA